MTDKITLTSFASLQNDTSATTDLNNNNAIIVGAINNSLSRDGTQPNTMGSNLDMNSFHILNLPTPININEPLRIADVNMLNGGGTITISPLPPGGATGAFLVKTSNADFAVGWTSSLLITGAQGGTGVSNVGKTITLGGNIVTSNAFTTAGAFPITLTATAPTVVTLPSTGSMATYASNGNFFGGTSALISLSTGIQNVGIGLQAGKNITTGTNNICVGTGSGQTMTTGLENVCIGAGAGSLITSDQGHTLVGHSAGGSLNGAGQTWNTFIGHDAGFLATTCGGCIAIGRAAGRGFFSDSDCLAIGHASVYYNLGDNFPSIQSAAVGNQAAGAPVDGTGTNWGGTGKTYWGMTHDQNVNYFGDSSGKSSVVGLFNCFALGSLARIPAKNNCGWIGNNLSSVGTLARVWEGYTSTTISNSAGVTLTAAQMVTGLIVRTGAPVAGFSDTTPTAAQLVAAGPGNGCEVPVSITMSYTNSTGQTATLVGGTGVSVSGGATVITSAFSTWKIIVTNSTPGTEAVTLQRVA